MHLVSRRRCWAQRLLPTCPEDRSRVPSRRLQRQLILKSDGDSSGTSLAVLRGAMDGFTDLLIGAAAADVAAHGFIDVGISGTRFLCQKRCRRHDLSRLAVAALRNIDFDPCLLT